MTWRRTLSSIIDITAVRELDSGRIAVGGFGGGALVLALLEADGTARWSRRVFLADTQAT